MNIPAYFCLLTTVLLAPGTVLAEPAQFTDLDPQAVLRNFKEHRQKSKELAAGPVSSGALPERPDSQSGRFESNPDWNITPGVLCTRDDKDFHEYRYPERIPYCIRNLSVHEKKIVSEWYNVPWEEHGSYQYDHLLSLCLGGSNDLHNIWPMPWDEARQKARLENDLCLRLKAGEVTQKAAIREELGWFAENAPHMLKRFKDQLR